MFLETMSGAEEIDVDTVDNILDDLQCPHVDFVEIMVNGAELEVLKGMDRILQDCLRLRIKGHAKEQTSGEDIGARIVALLKSNGLRTTRARPTAPRSEATSWGARAGDVYAARLA